MSQNQQLGTLGQVVAVNTAANTVTVNSAITVGNGTYNTVVNSTVVSVNNIIVTGKITANGGNGTAGQALTTNGSAVYWSTIVGTNTDAQYTWSNTQTFTNTITFSSVINGTANNTSFVGSVSAANVVSNAQLSANLTNYAPLAGATFSGDVTINANLIVSGTTVTVNTATLDVKDKNVTLAKGSTAAASDGAGITIDGSNIGWYYTYSSNTWTSNVGIIPSSNTSFDLGSTGLRWNSIYANNFYGTTVNAATYSVGTSFVANTSQVTISGIPLSANGGVGTAGQVLTSNGVTGAPYWAATAAGVNTAASYTWTNTHTFNANVTISGNATSVFSVGNSVINTYSNGYSGIISSVGESNPNTFSGGTYSTNGALNTVIAGPYVIATGNTFSIAPGSRVVIV